MLLLGFFLCYLGHKTVHAIDCFKCISMNNDYPPCEDPFHNNFTVDIYESPCMGGRRGRDGVFPATSCVKITGTFGTPNKLLLLQEKIVALKPSNFNFFESAQYLLLVNSRTVFEFKSWMEDSDETIMIRGCALDSGTLTTDTELVRMSHCGAFYYDNRYVHGCVQTCNDADACNDSFKLRSSFEITASFAIVFSAIISIY